MVDLGLRVRELRDVHGLTQEKLAEAVKWDPRWVQQTEKGTANLPLKKLIRLANVFGLDLPGLVTYPFDPNRKRKVGRPKKRKS